MDLTLAQGDITAQDVDAVVNAANRAMRGGGGVDGAIHRAAGPGLLAELMRYDRCPTGEAVLTGGHRLPARFVIHTVGPVWIGGAAGEDALLRRAYESVFRVAAAEGSIRTIAFPAISTGVYGYPKEPAARIALGVMRAHAHEYDRVIACLFDAESARLYERLLAEPE